MLKHVFSMNEYRESWEKGYICLHPTDTLPGLSFRADSENAWHSLCAIKGREPTKTSLALVDSLNTAKRYWQALPQDIEALLTRIWPDSLTLIWQASAQVSQNLIHQDGTLALRCPKLSNQNQWLATLIDDLTQPFPSTSVNSSGEKSAQTWSEALDWAENCSQLIVAPSWECDVIVGAKPSTIVKVTVENTCSRLNLIREGQYSFERIQEVMKDV